MGVINMKTKWEFIRDKLKELGYTELSERAEGIRKVMYKEFGRKCTDDWKRDYKYNLKREYGLNDIYDMCYDGRYCISCIMYYDVGCKGCNVAQTCDTIFSNLTSDISIKLYEDIT